MISINKPCRVILLHIPLVMLFFLSGCNEASLGTSASIYLKIPTQPVIHKLDLSAQQGLRDLTSDFSVREPGADSGITLLPSEKVEIFASGSASVQPGGKQSGPGGISTCHEPAMPEPSLPCYSVIYSVGINGGAGEVGTHVGFNPAAVGNLFLGMNAPHLASNAGSFHITVLIIPSGTFTGLWIAPEDGFTVQGTTLKLSAYVFAQNATIDEVQFTMAVPGQALLSICNAFKSGEDIYTCYAATNFTRLAAYQKVTGRWTVPPAQCSPGEISASAIWVGMTSGASDQSLLAQLGTDSDCQAGTPLYFMWWEMFPAPSVPLDQPLQAGDTVTATVTFQQSEFQLSIDAPKERVHFSTTQAGRVSDTSIAECIVEAPTIIDDPATNTGHVAQLTNFGQVSILCQLNNNEPIADGPQDVLFQMQTNAGISKAVTSALDQAGTTFTVQWHHG